MDLGETVGNILIFCNVAQQYALNRDAILKKRKEARDRKKAMSAILNGTNTPSKPLVAMPPGYSTFSVLYHTFH